MSRKMLPSEAHPRQNQRPKQRERVNWSCHLRKTLFPNGNPAELGGGALAGPHVASELMIERHHFETKKLPSSWEGNLIEAWSLAVCDLCRKWEALLLPEKQSFFYVRPGSLSLIGKKRKR